MENFKGTKGEWKAVKNDFYWDIKLDNTGYNIASTQENKFIEIFEAEEKANAKLIAAAPDLLEALQIAVKKQGYFSNEELIQARKAIKKALT